MKAASQEKFRSKAKKIVNADPKQIAFPIKWNSYYDYDPILLDFTRVEIESQIRLIALRKKLLHEVLHHLFGRFNKTKRARRL